MPTYVTHCRADHDFEHLLEEIAENGTVYWTVNPNSLAGDRVVFYVKKPVMSLVATGILSSMPEILDDEDHDFNGDTFADIEDLKLIHPLHLKDLQKEFPEWGWPRMPQSRVRIPQDYEMRFLDLLFEDRGWKWETTGWDADHGEWLFDVGESNAVINKTTVGESEEKWTGAGFGKYEMNRLVETAAIEAVWGWFENEGWQVVDRQADNRGYDLLCRSGQEELHVEVKGVSSSETSFIITQNEYQTALVDERYLICVVTNALSSTPEIEDFDHHDIIELLDFTPISYRATLRR